MAITRYVETEGYDNSRYRHDPINAGKFYIEEYFVGCVLSLHENNHYDDSDFYAVVWNEETQALENNYYDSTRYASNQYATIDATPEVRAKAEAYKLKIWRKKRADFLSKKNNETRKIALKHNVSISALRAFEKSTSDAYYEVCEELLSKNIRSSFKKSLRERLITWLNDKDKKYESPFSRKQWDALLTASQPFKLYY